MKPHMTFQKQIFDAINNNSVAQLQDVLENNTGVTLVAAVLGLRKACEEQNLECVELLIPYASKFFNQPYTSANNTFGQTMSLSPCDMLYQLMYDTVVPSNNAPMFELFTDLLVNEHMRQCQVILVQCFELGHVDLVDCLLPFLDDLSAVAQYKPQAYSFFEERKAVYQNQKLNNALGKTFAPSVSRKI